MKSSKETTISTSRPRASKITDFPQEFHFLLLAGRSPAGHKPNSAHSSYAQAFPAGQTLTRKCGKEHKAQSQIIYLVSACHKRLTSFVKGDCDSEAAGLGDGGEREAG